MPAPPSTIYVIAGCNGAGKTTFAWEFLPKEVKCLRFLNADEIARGLSPLAPSAAAIKAGRLLLSEVRSCLRKGETFALESTLSGLTYIRLFQQARSLGYQIELHYLWLSSATQAIARVRQRVEKGGHDVPAADIRRRFARSLVNLHSAYLPITDRWAVLGQPRQGAANAGVVFSARYGAGQTNPAFMKTLPTKLPAHSRVKRAAFEVRAERALRRAVRNVQHEHHRLGLPLIIWQDGRVTQVPAGV